MTVTIYTDGSCLMHTKKRFGGWGFISLEDEEWHVSGGELNTTNNRMELKAVIEALQSCDYTDYHIYSDSMYVINCATGKWKRSKNIDLWEEYSTISQDKNIKFTWVKAHTGDKYNELVNDLALNESRELNKSCP